MPAPLQSTSVAVLRVVHVSWRCGGHRKSDAAKYRRRNVIERCVSWLKECRRVATRYDKLGVNYRAMIELAIVQRLVRLLCR